MADRLKRKTAAVMSIVLGVVSVVMVGIMKDNLKKVPFIGRIMNMKTLGIDSMKDFLEVSELDLRIANDDPIQHKNKGVMVQWNSDESAGYTLFISNGPITKTFLLNIEHIDLYEWKDELAHTQEHWIKKAHVLGTRYNVELESAYCRVRSDNGRVSKEISFGIHAAGRHKGFAGEGALVKNEINCWLEKIEDDWFLNIIEPIDTLKGIILAYQIKLYLADGMGIIRSIGQFKRGIRVPLGPLKPCLCYIKGLRGIGIPVEQFVGWIGETLMNEDPELEQYTNGCF